MSDTLKEYYVTGTYHGSIVYAENEAGARWAFHEKYNGESITNVRIKGQPITNLSEWM